MNTDAEMSDTPWIIVEYLIECLLLYLSFN